MTKKGQREMTVFFARELLYDYAVNALDSERKAGVEKMMRDHHDLVVELEGIRRGLGYTKQMSGLGVAESLIEKIDEPETYLSVLLKKTNYERWPLTVKWAIEAVAVLSVFVIVLIAIPWDQALKMGFSAGQREVILAEMNRSPKDASLENSTTASTPAGADFEDEGAADSKKSAAVAAPPTTLLSPTPITVPVVTKVTTTTIRSAVTTTTIVASAAVQVPTVTLVANGANPGTSSAAQVAPKPAVESKAKPSEGMLYRGTLQVANLPVTGPRIAEKITEMGGRKAGEVDLGWRKTPTSAYYHFTIPEAKYDDLMKFMGDYGQPRVSKEAHPRVMPDGIIRLIITVDETAP